ncbi:hypothetical protein SDC9_103888 [bioreactor metagenome]|uniref:Uncharacterized protein n=1 Tax=bioreactor metagenome TaxID=1076179 RepID=A0A645AVA3_9ZZZZ
MNPLLTAFQSAPDGTFLHLSGQRLEVFGENRQPPAILLLQAGNALFRAGTLVQRQERETLFGRIIVVHELGHVRKIPDQLPQFRLDGIEEETASGQPPLFQLFAQLVPLRQLFRGPPVAPEKDEFLFPTRIEQHRLARQFAQEKVFVFRIFKQQREPRPVRQFFRDEHPFPFDSVKEPLRLQFPQREMKRRPAGIEPPVHLLVGRQPVSRREFAGNDLVFQLFFQLGAFEPRFKNLHKNQPVI